MLFLPFYYIASFTLQTSRPSTIWARPPFGFPALLLYSLVCPSDLAPFYYMGSPSLWTSCPSIIWLHVPFAFYYINYASLWTSRPSNVKIKRSLWPSESVQKKRPYFLNKIRKIGTDVDSPCPWTSHPSTI